MSECVCKLCVAHHQCASQSQYEHYIASQYEPHQHLLYPHSASGKEIVDIGKDGRIASNTSNGGVVSSKRNFSESCHMSNITCISGSSSCLSAASRQLLQKRKRKARLGMVEQQQESPCKRFLDEDGIVVNGTSSSSSSSESSSCSSRSSSSGVSSDFDELDTTINTSMNVVASGTSRGEDCQSSSSECEEEDEESSPLPTAPPDAPNNTCKNSASCSSIINNKDNLTNLTCVKLNSVSVDVGAIGKSVCSKNVRTDRTVSGKIPHKAMHTSSAQTGTTKMEIGTGPSRSKHANGSSASSTTSGSTDNDRDTDTSFSEFPSDLDFIGVPDKSKRRTDRYDSSESSDSGVATLSPSTSDSPELISTCCDFSSDHLDVGNLISVSSSSSSLSTASSYPPKCSSSSSSCSGGVCLTETQRESTGAGTPTVIIEETLPTASVGTDTSSLTTTPTVVQETSCMWENCACSDEASHNILEHIQTAHVAPQMKSTGYICLWEGCKVFNKRSSSLSWLERHVLSHSGNKPFKCIFPGCGLSFSSQTALERHVNSHIATNGTTSGAQGNSTVANKKMDASPAKSSRRKKIRFRKQRINMGNNIGQRVDYFDKRIMEVIKHWLASSVDQYAVNAHDCTFRAEVMGRRVIEHCEPEIFVRWHPRFVFPDEFVPQSKFSNIKLVPLRRIPSDKIRLLYPALFPPQRQGKASRKRKPRSHFAPSAVSTPTHSDRSSSLSTLPPSPGSSPQFEIPSYIDSGSFPSSSRSSRSSSSSSSASTTSTASTAFSTSSSCFSSPSSSSASTPEKSIQQDSTIMMDSSSSGIKVELEEEEDKCHKKFCGSSRCDCPSAPNGDDVDEDVGEALDSSHWAYEILLEDLGMLSS